MKVIDRRILTCGEELQLLEPDPASLRPTYLYDLEAGEALEARPFARRHLIRLALATLIAWVLALGVGAAIWLWGLYAIGMAVFTGMLGWGLYGLIDAGRSIVRRAREKSGQHLSTHH